jgi:hypothetical protein
MNQAPHDPKENLLFRRELSYTNAGKLIYEHMILGCTVIKERVDCCCCVPMDLIIHGALCWIAQHLLSFTPMLVQCGDKFQSKRKHLEMNTTCINVRLDCWLLPSKPH